MGSENESIGSLHIALQKEHESVKLICTQTQKKFDGMRKAMECERASNGKQAQTIKNLNELMEKYERVNIGQNEKIKKEKENAQALREKIAVLDAWANKMFKENESLLAAVKHLEQQKREENENENVMKLSAVNEDSECKHALFPYSESFKLSSLESMRSERRGSILQRIRSLSEFDDSSSHSHQRQRTLSIMSFGFGMDEDECIGVDEWTETLKDELREKNV